MKIIILGAGGWRHTGGKTVGENNDITVVDTNGERLRTLQDKFDLRVVQGMALIHAYCGRRVPTTPICWLL